MVARNFFHFVMLTFLVFTGCKETVSPEREKTMPYNSIKRRIISQSLVEKTLVAGSDITLTPISDANTVLGLIQYSDYNHKSNIRMHNIGLFSNFADGLIFKNPWNGNGIDVAIRTRRLDVSMIDGEPVAWSIDSKIIEANAGTGSFNTQAAAGDVLAFEESDNIYPLGIIETVNSDDQVTLTSFPLNLDRIDLTSNIYIGRPESSVQYTSNIVTLNQLYNLSEYLNPGDLIGDGEYVSIEFLLDFKTSDDIIFSRDAISSDYDGEDVFFNIVSTLEYTKGN